MKKVLLLVVVTVIMVMAINGISQACGIIDIDRRPLPPNEPVTNISVKNTVLDIKIEEQVAVVVVDEVFHNPNNRQLEGTFILPILPETAVQNLSLWINGKETKGELLDKDKAFQYYQEIVRRMIDPHETVQVVVIRTVSAPLKIRTDFGARIGPFRRRILGQEGRVRGDIGRTREGRAADIPNARVHRV